MSKISEISTLKKMRNYHALTIIISDIQLIIASLNIQKNSLLQIRIEKDIESSQKKK